MPSLKLSNPFRRGGDRPSLKERAANLKAAAGRIMRRKPGEAGADQGRRMVVAGSVASAVTVPLPALASACLPVGTTAPHPDQALFDAETAYLAARDSEHAAQAEHSHAYAAYEAALGELPAPLVAPEWALVETAHPGMRLGRDRIRFQITGGADEEIVYRWTVEGLNRAIAALPRAFGRAGTTPMRIRALRTLVPIAEAYEARMAEAKDRFHTVDLGRRRKEAGAATRQARNIIAEAVAITPAGLAVKVRRVVGGDWYKADRAWDGLLRSAASVSGVALADPFSGYDAAGCVQAWEAIGGRVLQGEPGFSANFHCPRSTSGEHADALRAETTRLIAELDEHRDAIEHHVRGRA
ncbi:hypothetical protein [Methylobacterium sp. J-090]|uniref:hypothetical protein n=1 Tax=Methylobacterium sp. J-090 TaxID=2836666 RepID=UPI001FB8B625|nr:hypothetical protein [Methylobacterium sp. J-090]MCJ2079857.1 hypothetical protein [Methylobacterium sp. J-090]